MDTGIKGLTARDLEEALAVTRTALESNNVDELRIEVLRLLERVFRTSSSNFFLTVARDQRIDLERVVSRGIEEKFLAQFRLHYCQMDPFLKVSPQFPRLTVLTTDQIIPFKDFVLGDYYNDFLKPQSIHYQMTLWLKRGDQVLGVLALFRPPNAQNFSSVDRAKALLMTPCLAAALYKTVIADNALLDETIIDSIIADLPNEGIIVLDDSLELVYRNENAIRILSRPGRAGQGQRANLGAALPSEVYHYCEGLVSSHGVEAISKSFEARFHLICSVDDRKISLHGRLIRNRGKPLILICMEPFEPMESLSKQLAECGLSRRELDVLLLLSKGLKNNEIGEKLFISPHTVDNHLKSIYRKMGVANRTAATRRLMEITSSVFPLVLSSHS
jgi:DNA-binding CsgD family transcriptional regulator